VSEQGNIFGDLHSGDFNAEEAARRADVGMSNAYRAARVAAWKTHASAWLDRQPSGREIVADDLVRVIGLPDIGPARNNVVGAWFSAQSKRGRIVFAQRLRKSERSERHGNLQRVWRVV